MAFNYQARQISSHLWRLTCHNPSALTGPGTNSYILCKNGHCAVIDAGPIDSEHQQAIIDFCASNNAVIDAFWVTHMHPDHSPQAVQMSQQLAVPLHGPVTVDDPYQDTSCVPKTPWQHGQIINFHGLSIEVIHTPGHVDNHLCYLLQDDHVLLSGDHIMQASTVVIIPPHGKMKAYLESLALLKNYRIDCIAPAHGEPITDAIAEVDRLIAHRLGREAKVLAALQQLQSADIKTLTPVAYADVNPALHGIAELSLWAHLIKLETEGHAYQQGEQWQIQIQT